MFGIRKEDTSKGDQIKNPTTYSRILTFTAVLTDGSKTEDGFGFGLMVRKKVEEGGLSLTALNSTGELNANL